MSRRSRIMFGPMNFHERASQLDASDPLRSFRDRFAVDDPAVTYLDGNSLGRRPKATADVVAAVVETWGNDLIGGWNGGWFDLSERLGAKIAGLIGAKPNEVIVCDSTSVNLFKLASAAMAKMAPRTKIVSDSANFPSDLYVLSGLGELALDVPPDDQTALVSYSHVEFKSGRMRDGLADTRSAHEAGALMLWDLSHSVGAVHVELNGWGADLAVGCCYKYLNGGPGAPAFLYVREDLQAKLTSPIRGWFGQSNPFAFGLTYAPASNLWRFLAGTPPILAVAAIEPGVDLVAEAGIDRIRQKSSAQTEFLIELFDAWLASLGCVLRTPRDAKERGSHVSVGHPHAWQITQALIANHRVIPDFRTPDCVRFGVTPLYTTYVELVRGLEAMRDVVSSGSFAKFPSNASGVT